MMRAVVLAALLAAGLSVAAAEAGERSSDRGASSARVKGYTARRGGYSYTYPDTINTYGDSRTRYGSVNAYRDPSIDRQSQGGPFDHGFFFDSARGAYGSQSPYLR